MEKPPVRIRTISEFHQFRGLPSPAHPLISVIDYSTIKQPPAHNATSWVLDFYSISIKRTSNAKMRYGQQDYDFDEGVMFFMAPGQVFGVTAGTPGIPVAHTGWILLVHPDFLWNTPLAKTMRKHEYFDYAVNEALFLSEKEETTMHGIIQNIQQEYHGNIDTFSQGVMVAQLELLLAYADRFYQRQFITRKISSHKLLDRLEALLSAHFQEDNLLEKALPTVQGVADALCVSPNYLSGLLKSLTGQNTQQHIHAKLIEQAKERLSTTELSVGEIAFALGFEHPQSFSKLFKAKSGLSPLAFREQFQ